MAYVAPTWVNGQAPALDAEALNAISQALEKLPMENGGTFATSGAAGLYNLINAAATLTSGTLASGDYIGIKDVSAGTGKQVTLSNLASWIVTNGSGAKISTGSYTGTGTYGLSNKNTIICGVEPYVLFIFHQRINISFSFENSGIWVKPSLFINTARRYQSVDFSTNMAVSCQCSVSGNSFTWYLPSGESLQSASAQLNGAKVQYNWLAIGV